MPNPGGKTLIRLLSVLVVAMLFVGILIFKTRKAEFVLAQSQKSIRQNEKPNPEKTSFCIGQRLTT